MKKGLPILPLVVLAVAVGALAAFRDRWMGIEETPVAAAGATIELGATSPPLADFAPAASEPSLAKAVPAEAGADSADGQSLIRQAIAQLERYATLQSRLRFRGEVLGRQLLGTGTYRQSGHGENFRLRFELRTQATDQVTSQVQVCDGRYFWTHSDVGSQNAIYRIDLQKLRRAREDQLLEAGKTASGARKPQVVPVAATSQLTMQPGALQDASAPGGLAAILAGLLQNVEWGSAVPETLDATPVWRIRGRWRKEQLAELVAENDRQAFIAAGEPDVGKLPPHVPQQIVIDLGRKDAFPFRIEFFRQRGKKDSSGPPGSLQSLVSLEFFEVQANRAIADATFQFSTAGKPFIDVTDRR